MSETKEKDQEQEETRYKTYEEVDEAQEKKVRYNTDQKILYKYKKQTICPRCPDDDDIYY